MGHLDNPAVPVMRRAYLVQHWRESFAFQKITSSCARLSNVLDAEGLSSIGRCQVLVSMLFPIKFDKELYTKATVKGNGELL